MSQHVRACVVFRGGSASPSHFEHASTHPRHAGNPQRTRHPHARREKARRQNSVGGSAADHPRGGEVGGHITLLIFFHMTDDAKQRMLAALDEMLIVAREIHEFLPLAQRRPDTLAELAARMEAYRAMPHGTVEEFRTGLALSRDIFSSVGEFRTLRAAVVDADRRGAHDTHRAAPRARVALRQQHILNPLFYVVLPTASARRAGRAKRRADVC